MTNRIQGLSAALPFRRTTIKFALYLPLLVLMAWGCKKSDTAGTLGDWRRRADFEGVARTAAAGFTIGNYAFVGTGSDRSNNRLTDFRGYDQARNTWFTISPFPGVARYGGIGFSVGNKGYVGLGIDANGVRLKDFYEFTPSTNITGLGTWRKIADFAGTGRINAVAFSIGSKGYVGTGNDLNDTNDFYSYDPAADRWTKIASYSGAKRIGAVAFVINNLGYVGTGTNNSSPQNDWWAYDPASDTWIEKAKFTTDQRASIQRVYGVGFVINGKGYLTQGAATSSTVWEYDPSTDLWTERGTFEGTSRQNGIGFSLGTKGYVTTGGAVSSAFDDLWEFDPAITQDTDNQ